MDWLRQNWSVVIAGGALLAVLVGFGDVETTTRLGVEWDRGLIQLGIGALIAGGPPAVGRMASALRHP